MFKLSDELIRTLKILPNDKLDEVVTYIDTIKKERKAEKVEAYENALTKIFDDMVADGFTEIKITDANSILAGFDLDTLDVLGIL